jgi:hypothetical protein
VVREDERILLDRVRRIAGETAETFDPKLEQFLKQHPEVVATDVELGTAPTRPDEPVPGDEPPKF